jgi:molybdopterin molybdotransferase
MTEPAPNAIAAPQPDTRQPDLPVVQAQELIARSIVPLDGMETVPLPSALGRVLAYDVVSPIDVPAHDNSAMDGYAFAGAALGSDALSLKVAGAALAGHRHAQALGAGECVRIMTGAVMPPGCDTVIPQELVQCADAASITIAPGTVKAGDNRRLRGEDLAAGGAALHCGRILRPADLGLLASLGIGEVQVRRRLRVAYFSTGDELQSLGEPLEAGCVYDSNRYTIGAMLERLGCEGIDMGVVRDEPHALKAALADACAQADVILTSGGASSGDADHTARVMSGMGDVLFWKLAVRPGRPMAFGRITAQGREAILFGLPGNPVAVMTSFYFFARSALLQMMGVREKILPPVRAVALTAVRKRAGRTEYLRAILECGIDGQAGVRLTGAQGSGILRSMSEANCFVILAHDSTGVAAGDMVDVVLFDGLC